MMKAYRLNRGQIVYVRLIVLAAIIMTGPGCTLIDRSPSRDQRDGRPSPTHLSSRVTTAHATIGEALRDFFGVRPSATQPIQFPHDTHIARGVSCTEYCHESAVKGPVAGLPSVKTCMICHDAIAADRPLIRQITDLQAKGLDLAWQRVYGYADEAHVRFNHAPHIRASVECATCHGDVAHQKVARRNVDLNMGFCVTCHAQRKASIDCLTCHF